MAIVSIQGAKPNEDLIGISDLGGKASRTHVGRHAGGKVQTKELLRTPLTQELIHQNGHLSDQYLDETLQSLENAHTRLADLRAPAHLIIGTASLRRAPNIQELLDLAAEQGTPITPISGIAEAMFIGTAAIQKLAQQDPDLVAGHLIGVKIGGASFESFHALNGRIITPVSIDVGARDLYAELHSHTNHVTPLLDQISDAVRGLKGRKEIRTLAACGGLMNDLGQIRSIMFGKSDKRIRASELIMMQRTLQKQNPEITSKLFDIKPDKAQFIAAASTMLLTLMDVVDVNEVRIPGVNLRHGICHTYFKYGTQRLREAMAA